jgi:hypothetical protein
MVGPELCAQASPTTLVSAAPMAAESSMRFMCLSFTMRRNCRDKTMVRYLFLMDGPTDCAVIPPAAELYCTPFCVTTMV